MGNFTSSNRTNAESFKLRAVGIAGRKELQKMAERVGFEPTVGVNLHTLSKRAP